MAKRGFLRASEGREGRSEASGRRGTGNPEPTVDVTSSAPQNVPTTYPADSCMTVSEPADVRQAARDA